MKIAMLASGSKGNAIYVEGESGAVLIDAGFSAKEIIRRLEVAGGQRDLIRAILVTHEHSDHIRGVDILARRLDIPVVATKGTLAEFLQNRKVSEKPIMHQSCSPENTLVIDGFEITPFSTFHDACEPCGFLIRDHDITVGCCTDTGMVSDRMRTILGRCDALVLESNHCQEMLQTGPYPAFLKRRIRSKTGHLSNSDAARCLSLLAADLQAVALAHLSEINNTPLKAKSSALEGFGLYRDVISLTIGLQDGSAPMIFL